MNKKPFMNIMRPIGYARLMIIFVKNVKALSSEPASMARNITIIPPQMNVPSTVTRMLARVRVVPINHRMMNMLAK